MDQKRFSLYKPDQLPSGFAYPEGFKRFAETGKYPKIYPWWFIDSDSRAGDLIWSIRANDGRNLIPFAKVDDGRGDVACFDGDDTTGDPKVEMLILDESGRKYSFDNFNMWLDAAIVDAGKY